VTTRASSTKKSESFKEDIAKDGVRDEAGASRSTGGRGGSGGPRRASTRVDDGTGPAARGTRRERVSPCAPPTEARKAGARRGRIPPPACSARAKEQAGRRPATAPPIPPHETVRRPWGQSPAPDAGALDGVTRPGQDRPHTGRLSANHGPRSREQARRRGGQGARVAHERAWRRARPHRARRGLREEEAAQPRGARLRIDHRSVPRARRSASLRRRAPRAPRRRGPAARDRTPSRKRAHSGPIIRPAIACSRSRSCARAASRRPSRSSPPAPRSATPRGASAASIASLPTTSASSRRRG